MHYFIKHTICLTNLKFHAKYIWNLIYVIVKKSVQSSCASCYIFSGNNQKINKKKFKASDAS
jgi:hypothetical protein